MAEAKAERGLVLPGFGEGSPLSGLTNLSILRQIGILLGIAASVALGGAFLVWFNTADYRPLGTLDQQETIQIINYLQSSDTPYRMDAAGVVMVPTERFQQIKLQLAQQGLLTLPAGADDSLKQDSGFGVSQKLESARLQQGQEKELARTIEQIAGVKAAKVHLALPKDSVFVKDRAKPSASVMLSLFSGRSLDPAAVESIVNYVASSVPNLEPSRVTVIDQNARLLNAGGMGAEAVAQRREFEAERQREDDYATRVRQILEPLVGHGRFTVQVDVDMDFTQNEQTQQLYNPAPVVRSESTSENPTGAGGPSGVPGALTNQPPQDATTPEVGPQTKENGQPGSALASTGMRREATRNYELDTTISHTRQQPGQIRRVSVSVGLDFKDVPAPAEGEAAVAAVQRVPREAAELENITRLVKAAVGFVPARGDAVEVLSFPFTPVPTLEDEGIPFWERAWFRDIIKYLAAALVAFVLIRALFGFMRALAKPVAPSVRSADDLARLQGEEVMLPPDTLSINTLGGMSLPAPMTGPAAEQLAKAKSVVGNDPALVAQLVKDWIAEE
ncbi:MAG: flagellar M-ring protein FliF [Gammaproteobacteria bacterium]|nr:flagellar M-ring protein FliF [Gammaproteobacteria bacterium]